MFWNKKPKEEKKPQPQPDARELEIVDRIIRSMEERPDTWLVKKPSYGTAQLSHAEVRNNQTTHLIEVTIGGYAFAKVYLNSATLNLTDESREGIEKAGQELVKEQTLRSLIRTEELKAKSEKE